MSPLLASFRSLGRVGLLLMFCWLLTSISAQAQPTDLPPAQPRLVPQIGHTTEVYSAVFSPDGKQILTTSSGKAWLWDVATGKFVRTFQGAIGFTNSAIFSPDGKQILTTNDDCIVRLWDVATGQIIRTFKENSDSALMAVDLPSAVFSPDGKQILTAGGDMIARLWDVGIGQIIHTFKEGHRKSVTSAVFSPSGKQVLTVDAGKTVRLWDAATGEVVRTIEGHASSVRSAVFSPDGKLVLTVDAGKAVRLWDVGTGRIVHIFRLEGTGSVDKAAFSPDGKQILTATSTSGKLVNTVTGKTVLETDVDVAQLWDIATGRIVRTFQEHTDFVSSFALGSAVFSPDGKQILTASTNTGVQLWEVATGKPVSTFQGHTHTVRSAVFSPDSKQILTASSDKTARLWDVTTGEVIRVFQGHTGFVLSAVFSPDGKQILTTSNDTTIRLWNITTGRVIHIFQGPTDSAVPYYGTARNSGHFLFQRRTGTITSATFLPDGKQILTINSNTSVQLWNIATGQITRTFHNYADFIRSRSLPTEGRQLLKNDGSRIHLLDAITGKIVRTFQGHASSVRSAVFSPDKDQVLTANDDMTAQLWDVTTGEVIRVFQGHTGSVLSAVFSPDGKQILTTSNDTTVRLWDAATGQELCQMLSFDDGTWAVVDSQGRYDASNAGDIEGLVWALGNEPIALKQFQDAYYEPFLLAKITGSNPDPIRPVPVLNDLRLYPAVQLSLPAPGTNRLKITLTNRGGGIGKVQVLINGKQLQGDARAAGLDPHASKVELPVDLVGAAVVPGALNRIEVKVSNAQGTLESRSVMREWQAPGELVPKNRPHLYAIVVGIGKYGDPTKLKTLTFSTKDARDMVQAIRLSGQGALFGPKNVHITWLTSETSLEPVADVHPRSATKTNIENAFAEVAKVANPEDVLVVYFSGHGLTLGQGSSVYCYPTQDARTAEFAGSPFLKDWAVTSEELARWTDAKRMAPQKQVLILDTCAAGVAAVKLNEHKELSGDQVRAVQRLQDRSGFHVLMGTAADAVSYEASRYGQGLLTYALLEGLRGPALRNENFVDVGKWFHYAEERVPELAQGIGGVQKPEIAAPKGSTFDVGELPATLRSRLPPTRSYSLVLRPRLSDAASLRGIDTLGLNTLLRSRLRDTTEATIRGVGEVGKAGLVYVDAEEMTDALEVGGRYTLEDEKVTVELGFFRNATDVGESLKVEGTKSDLSSLADKIAQALQTALAKLPETATR